MNNEQLTKELNVLCNELHEQAQELIDCGNSKEKAEGWGMQKVIDAIHNLCVNNTNN